MMTAPSIPNGNGTLLDSAIAYHPDLQRVERGGTSFPACRKRFVDNCGKSLRDCPCESSMVRDDRC
ncbi:MAG: hypothetical protein AAGF98_06960 [Cyanobacteria bacterium P01_H01_bin.153]